MVLHTYYIQKQTAIDKVILINLSCIQSVVPTMQ